MAETSGAAERLASELEITKLAHELDLGVDELAFLRDQPADALRALRRDVSSALYRRHERRFRRVAALSSMVPATVAARAAQLAVGPVVSARIAAALDPDEAVKLAGRLPAPFLAELALSLDPERSAAIIRRLEPELVVEVGRVLLAEGESLVLGRFVAVVDPEVALRLVDGADPGTLLDIALLADDRSALSALVGGLGEPDVRALLKHCDEMDRAVDALTLLTALDDEALRHLVNVPTTAHHDVLEAVLEAGRATDHGPLLVRLLVLLDDDHVGVLSSAPSAHDPEVHAWLRSHAGSSGARLEELLDGLVAS